MREKIKCERLKDENVRLRDKLDNLRQVRGLGRAQRLGLVPVGGGGLLARHRARAKNERLRDKLDNLRRVNPDP